ncbi:MAG: RNA polymerase sigma factor [bacterium]
MAEEKELIERAVNGEESAYQKILNLYKGRIFSYIFRLVKNYDDAEELTFDTFIRFFKSLKSFDTSRSISSWLFTCAHNLVVDFFRRNKIEYEYLDEKYAVSDNLAEKFETAERLKQLETALGQLVPIDREIVILFHREELSYQEISDIIKLPVSTIKTRLHRARKKLKRLLE